MKKVFVFAAFAFILSSCDSTAKYKPMIEELATNWDTATSAVTQFAGQIAATQSDMNNMSNDLNVAPEVKEKWNDDAKAQFGQIQTAAQTSMGNLTSLSSEVDAFVTDWTAKGAELQALKDGAAAGKLEGDVQAKIAELTAASTDATAKLADWGTKFSEIQAAAATAKQQLATFMEASSAAATSGKK